MKKDYIVELREEEANELMDDHWVGELIRCKDCKHGYKCEFSIRCENKNMPPMFGQHFSENWFCADGERRTDDG